MRLRPLYDNHLKEASLNVHTIRRRIEFYCSKRYCSHLIDGSDTSHTISRGLQEAGSTISVQPPSGKSAWTIHLQSCALSKAYHCTSSDWGIDLPARERKNTRHSRVATQQDRHVSQVQHADLIRFLQHTGLRRHEAAALLPEDLCCSNGP